MYGDGRILKRGKRYWISYCINAKERREPGGKTPAEAKRKLRARMQQIRGGVFIGPKSVA